MAEHEPFTFTGGSDVYGIIATDKLAAEDAANFLNDKEEIAPIKKVKKEAPTTKTPKNTPNEVEGEDEEEAQRKAKKSPSQEEVLALLSGDPDEEEDAPDDDNEEDNEEPVDKKPDPLNKEKNKATSTEDESDDEEENQFVTISKDLFKMGVFTLDEDEEEDSAVPTTPEEFSQRWELEGRKKAIGIVDTFLSSKGEEHRQFFDAIMVKGVDPKEFLQRYVKIESIKNLDLTKPEDQEKIVRENLKRQGYPAESVENKLKRFVEYGEIEEEAKLAQSILLKREEEEGRALVAKKQQEVALRTQQKAEFTNNISKILTDKVREKGFDGIPVDIKSANSVGHYLTAEKYTTEDGKTLTQFDKDILDLNRPENHARKVKIALLMQMLETDPTLSKIQKKAISTESNALFQKLKKDKKETPFEKVKKDKAAQNSSWF